MGSIISYPSSKWSNIHPILSKSTVVYTTIWNLYRERLPFFKNMICLDGSSQHALYTRNKSCFVCSYKIPKHELMIVYGDGLLCYSCWQECIKSFLIDRLMTIDTLPFPKEIILCIISTLKQLMPREEFLMFYSSADGKENCRDIIEYIDAIKTIYTDLVRVGVVLPCSGKNNTFEWNLNNYNSIHLNFTSFFIHVHEYEFGMGQVHRKTEHKTIHDALSYVKNVINQ